MTTESAARLKAALEGRYEIVRPIGSGGMATVYLAEDVRHDRRVAVKVLREDFAANLGSGRFLEEIRIAAKLTHPHIMPVHDSGDAQGILYYVMPFAEGESLRERLHRDREMPIEEAVALLGEIVDALGYAHEHGVVHRDVKPGNILMHGRHPMIVDFGVAKALSEAVSRKELVNTAEGMAIGTPAYMAPEQAAAAPSVDYRADLYSVGILAFELLTGRTPFSGGTPQSILTRQITEQPERVETYRPDVSPELSAWVSRCLEKKPADRWQSAEEMLTALRAVSSVTVETAAPGESSRVPSRARMLVMMTAVAAVLLLGFFGLRGSAIDESSRVVVSVFENQTGNPSYDPVGHMLQDWLTDGLLQSGLLEVVPTITARQAAGFILIERGEGRVRDPILELSRETGAGLVVAGTLYLEGENLRIQTSVTDASDEEAVRLVGTIDPVVGPAADVTPLFDEVRNRLLGSLATGLNRRIVAQVGESSAAPTYEAYEAMNRGLDHYAAREYAEASALFLEAFEIDPTYPVPLVYASLSLRNHSAWARSDSVVQLLEERLDELSEYQRHWVDYSRSVLQGDLEGARVAIRRAAALSPQSKAAYNWALTAVRMGLPEEARSALASLDPERGAMRGISRYWMRQIEASHELGEHELELQQVEELERRYPDERSLFFNKVWVYSALGWTESLKAVFADETMSRTPPDVIAVRFRSAAVDLFVHGHVTAAEEFARLGVDFIDSQTEREGISSFNVGISLQTRQQLMYQKGRMLEVLGDRLAALELYRELYRESPHAWFFRAHSGVVAASLGQISDAMEIDRWLEELDVPYGRGEPLVWRAGIAARLGDFQRSTALLLQAREEGTYWTELHPVFHLYDAMREYEPFLELMAPQG